MKSAIELYIVQKVKEQRKKRKMSQRYLADCLNVSQSFIRNIENENDDTAYNIDHLNEIGKIFDCSIRDFFPEKYL
jgi:transcriptional regulator with XRE-family HTH domain